MIYSIFVNKFSKTLEKYKYDKRFVSYLLFDFLYKNNCKSNYVLILNYLKEYYGDIINPQKTFEYLLENFERNEDVFSLSDSQKDEFLELKRIEYTFYSLEIKGEKYIYKELLDNLYLTNMDLDYLLAIIYSFINGELELQDDYILMICFDIISNKNTYLDKIDHLLYMEEEKNDIELSTYLLSDKLRLLLFGLGVKKVSDLSLFSNEIILALFSHNLERIMANIYYHKNSNYVYGIRAEINDIFDLDLQKDERKKEIVYERCGIGVQSMTLESIAGDYGLTRERIRQIVEKSLSNIKKKGKIFEFDSLLLFNIMAGLNKNYLTKEEFLEFIHDKCAVDKLCFMSNEFDLPINYDSNYEVLYNPNEYSISDLILDVELKLGRAFGVDLIENYDSFEKAVIKSNYRIVNDGLYVKKGVNIAEIVVEIVDELFPDGFKIGSDDDFESVSNEFKRKFHTNCSIGARHALEADLVRYDYCYIDRGMVVNRKYVPTLAPDLIAEINEYLLEANDIVYYQSLFEAFKDKLSEYGINNRYYLKGVIDNYLSSEFTHQRDYIITGKRYSSSADFFLSEINASKGVVDLTTIKNKFPGIKDYVFLNYIYKMDGVIWIKYMQSFIFLSNISISNEFKQTLIENIDYLFKSLNSNVIVCSKLYARMRLLNEDLMKEVELFDNEFAFFSLVSTLLDGKYYFRRPYISCDASIDLSHNSLIVNYINTLQKFNPQILQSYVNKMHLRYIDSYLDFLISNSELFVQINIDTAVKKDLLMINENILMKIKNDLNYYINSFGPIDSRKYNDYSNLPRLRTGWNKYLLVGIIRTFLNNEYIIEYTDSVYNMTDFIIRRK